MAAGPDRPRFAAVVAPTFGGVGSFVAWEDSAFDGPHPLFMGGQAITASGSVRYRAQVGLGLWLE